MGLCLDVSRIELTWSFVAEPEDEVDVALFRAIAIYRRGVVDKGIALV
jgi:hypothetical protein